MIGILADAAKRLIHHHLDKAKEEVSEQIDAQVAEIESRFGNIATTEELSDALEVMTKIPGIVEAAQNAKMPLKQWVLETLSTVADPNYASIMIERKAYAELRKLAYARGITIEDLTSRREMAEWIQAGLDNRRI